jgi:atypical dual specificity phosphatase
VTNPIDWLLPDSLAACVFPDAERGLPYLSRLGITVLINLNERRHDPDVLAHHGMAQVHLPVPDFTSPTPAQLDAGVTAIVDALAAGHRLAVHCQAGLGRTGTLLACYLVRQGMTADEAIARVRAVRPGSIETREQQFAVVAFARRHQQPV